MIRTASPSDRRHSTLFVIVVAFFVADLLVSNVIAAKAVHVGFLELQAADFIFPVTYILGDVLTEVYGYARARQAIWIGFACNLFAVLAIKLGQYLPAHESWGDQTAYEAILGSQVRILIASFSAYLVGEFVNAYILARLKVLTAGRFLWVRTIGSTIFGQGCDTAIFMMIAFYGDWPNSLLFSVMLSQWLFKIAYETLATPLTYLIVNSLKRQEGVEIFDRKTDFNPFALDKSPSA